MIKEIPKYAGRYIANSNGNIYTLSGYIRYGRYLQIRDTKKLSTSLKRNGYLSVRLQFNGKSEYVLVHRIIAECFIPNPENKPTVNHRDGNKLNNHDKLTWLEMIKLGSDENGKKLIISSKEQLIENTSDGQTTFTESTLVQKRIHARSRSLGDVDELISLDTRTEVVNVEPKK